MSSCDLCQLCQTSNATSGSGATAPSPGPSLGPPNVAVADKDADADTPEKKAEKKAAIEAMYGEGSMYADNTKPGLRLGLLLWLWHIFSGL